MNEDLNRRLAKIINEATVEAEHAIAGAEPRLIAGFKHSLDSIRAKIAKMYERYGDTVNYNEMMVYNRLTNLELEIAKELKALGVDCTKTISSTIKDAFSTSYYKTGYAMESTLGAGLGFGMLNQNTINANIANQMTRIKWGDRLAEEIKVLNRQVQSELTSGLIQGKGYSVIAQGIADKTGKMGYKAVRIARTEGQRAVNAGQFLAFEKSEQSADRLGWKGNRVWVSALDERTREDHRALDQKPCDPVTKLWTFPNGITTPAPLHSGVAEEDINCRCSMVYRLTEFGKGVKVDPSARKYDNYEAWATEKGIKPGKGFVPKVAP